MAIDVGLIGTGIFSRKTHLPAIQHSKGGALKLVSVANRTKSKAQDFAKDAGVKSDKVYTKLEELIADPDVQAIDALLPVQNNLDVVKKVLIDAKKPLSIEKPIAATLEDAREIVKLSNQTDVPFIVLENFVYQNGVAKLRQLLPRVGDVKLFLYFHVNPFNKENVYLQTKWRQHPQHIGGYLSDGGVHQVAFLTEVLGPVAEVSGAKTTQVLEISGGADVLTATFQLESGAFGNYTYSSALHGPKKNEFTIYGSKGTLVYDTNDAKNHKISFIDNIEPKNNETFTVDQDVLGGVQAEFDNFAEAVSKKDKSLIKATPAKAFHHLAIIAASLESSKNNGAVAVVEKV